MQHFIKKILPKLAFLPFALAIIYASVLFFNKIFYDQSPQSFLSATQASVSSVTPVAETPSTSNKIQVAVLLDVSGSMGGLLDQARGQLWEMVNQLDEARYNGAQPDMEIALYAYGVNTSGLDGSYSELLSPLTTDLDALSALLFDLKTSGSNEYCGQMIHKATGELSWSNSPDDLKFIFIAGNETFDQGSISFQDACAIAKGKGIIVNTIFCGNKTEGVETGWLAGAQAAAGEFMFIDHNQVTAYVASPYDDQINRLNSSLNGTYVTYNDLGVENTQRQAAQDANAQKLDKSYLSKRALSKCSKNYKSASWDLVEACKKKDFKWSKVDKKHLPKELQEKSEEELKAYVAEKEAERLQITTEIKELSTKRKKFVAEAQTTADSTTLDKVMVKTIKKQAAKKKYEFSK